MWRQRHRAAIESLFLFALMLVNAASTDNYSGHQPQRHARKSLEQTNCYQTKAEHQFPWWRIKFDEVVFVKDVVLSFGTIDQHDNTGHVEVRIGLEDISESKRDEAFDKNEACTLDQTASTGSNVAYTCAKPVATRFLSVQLVSACPPGSGTCPPRVLRLCQVQATGFPLSDKSKWNVLVNNWKTSDVEDVRQSSVAFLGRAHNALTNLDTQQSSVQSNNCNFNSSVRPDGRRVTTENYGRFDDMYIIDDIELSVIYHNPQPLLDYAYISTYVGMDSKTNRVRRGDTKCFLSTESNSMEQLNLNQTTVRKRCGNSIKGTATKVFYEAILSEETQDISPGKFHDCHFRGNKIVNFAYHKPTKQSHKQCLTDSFCSDQLVDGNIRYPGNCQLPTETDTFPWWRVDLLQPHVVKYVVVFGHEKQHNSSHLQIRVGMGDIAKHELGTHFTDNLLCTETRSPVGNGIVQCMRPLFGRYVSIQRVSCWGFYCDVYARPVPPLNICEVQVHGLPLSITYYGSSEEFWKRGAPEVVVKTVNNHSTTYVSHTRRWNKKKEHVKVAVDAVELFFHPSAAKSNLTVTLDVTVDRAHVHFDTIQLTNRYIRFPCKFALGSEVDLTYTWSTDELSEDPLWISQASIMKFTMARPAYSKNFTTHPLEYTPEVDWLLSEV